MRNMGLVVRGSEERVDLRQKRRAVDEDEAFDALHIEIKLGSRWR